VDSVAHRLIHEFRRAVAARVLDPILATCADTGLAADYRILPRYELPLRALLRARPEHHQPLGYDNWTSLLEGALQAVVAPLDGDPNALRSHTWGQANQVEFAHPLSPFLPIPRGWLNIPPEGLPGDTHTVRMQTPVEGVTLQMIVAPGQEAMGIFQMPGGQSGHPLSPYYRAGHRAWVEGRPTPFLPGPSHHRLHLKPK
jgi:penicillin amidase